MGDVPDDGREHHLRVRHRDVATKHLLPTEGRLAASRLGPPTYSVLFLCTGNSARSILAESLLNHWGRGKFRAYSAGSFPKGAGQPVGSGFAAAAGICRPRGCAARAGTNSRNPVHRNSTSSSLSATTLPAKSVPVWPGRPVTAHWGLPDPAGVEGTEAERLMAFRETLRALENRIKLFVSLPIASLDRLRVQEHVRRLGQMPRADGKLTRSRGACLRKDSGAHCLPPSSSAPASPPND